MKWNWGTTIALVIILFLAIMAGMVYVAMRQTNEMMDANYYEKEIQYQQLIDASRRYEQLPQDSLLKVAPDHIAIYIPTAQLQDSKEGSLNFYTSMTERRITRSLSNLMLRVCVSFL